MKTSTLSEKAAAAPAQPRLNYGKAAPTVLSAMIALQTAVNQSGLESSLLELVKLRASSLNHCAFCIDMHSTDALAAGETAERLFLLNAWHEVSVYSPRERAALRWTDALTQLPNAAVSDEVFSEVRAHFSEEELAKLTLAIVSINGWNRFGVGFKVPPRFAN